MDTKPNSWREFRRIVSVLPGRALLALTVTLLLIQVCVEMALNQALRGVVDAATTGLWPELAPLGLRLAALVALEVLIQWSKVRAVGAYAENGVAFLRDRVTTHLLNLSVPEIESRHSGDYVSRLTNDLNQVRTFLYISLRELIYQPVVAVWSFIFLLTISWQLTLAACAVLPLLLLATSAVSRPMAKNGKRLQESLARVNEISQDAIGGLEVSRVFAMADSLRTRYAGAVDETVRVNKSLARSRSLMYAFSHLLGFVPFTLCIGFGGYLAISGRMTAGGLAVFVNLMNNLTWPLSGLPRVLGEARAQLAASSRLLDILDTTPERSGGTSAAPAASASAIELQHLVFTYPGQGEPVLNDLSLEVRAGEMAALVGPSGSGKSTVMKVLLGFYPEYQGDVNVFGLSLRDWDLTALRGNMAYVSQDTYLFPGTIRENIAMGKPGLSDAEVTAAALAANAHDFIVGFPQGYETKVGELGGRLSGGQKQRLAIARAILKDAPIILLDEATSALDTESERLVQEALDRLMRGRTALVVAHRLSTISQASRVIVMDRGAVVECGTHQELLEKGGLYRTLYSRELISESSQGEEAV